jgi:hypothetical protein
MSGCTLGAKVGSHAELGAEKGERVLVFHACMVRCRAWRTQVSSTKIQNQPCMVQCPLVHDEVLRGRRVHEVWSDGQGTSRQGTKSASTPDHMLWCWTRLSRQLIHRRAHHSHAHMTDGSPTHAVAHQALTVRSSQCRQIVLDLHEVRVSTLVYDDRCNNNNKMYAVKVVSCTHTNSCAVKLASCIRRTSGLSVRASQRGHTWLMRGRVRRGILRGGTVWGSSWRGYDDRAAFSCCMQLHPPPRPPPLTCDGRPVTRVLG